MCEVLARNYNYRNHEAALFELGTEYIVTDHDKLPAEPVRLAVGMYGANTDFYDVKGVVEGLFEEVGIADYEVEAAGEDCGFDEVSAFHPGRVAVAKVSGKPIAIFGELHPDVLETYGIGTRAYLAKALVTVLLDIDIPEKLYKPLPKYPATVRDVSLVCADEIPVAQLEKLIKDAVGSTLEKITLFDVYKGEQIESGMKSVAFSISMRSHDATLTDEQADAAMKRVAKALKTVNAQIR